MVTAYKSAVNAKERVKVRNKKQADVGRDANIGVPANVVSLEALPLTQALKLQVFLTI